MTEPTPNPLDPHKIPCLPSSFYYIPNFLSPTECNYILSKIPSNRWTTLSHRRLQAHPSTLTKSNTLIAAPLRAWLTTYPPILERFRELGLFEGTAHGGPNHVLVNEYKAGEGIMPHEDGPAYSPVVATVSLGGSLCLDLFENMKSRSSRENGNGNWQVEGENGEQEAVNGLHGDEEVKMDENGRPVPSFRILQEPGSLLVTRGEAYECLLHGISAIERDVDLGPETVANWGLLGDRSPFEEGVNERGVRVSLTYRDVLKVSKVGLGVLGKR